MSTLQPLVGVRPLVGVIMGSKSDWETMQAAAEMLTRFGVAHECRIVSAHRTPEQMFHYGRDAESRGLRVIIAGAGGAAEHALPDGDGRSPYRPCPPLGQGAAHAKAVFRIFAKTRVSFLPSMVSTGAMTRRYFS